MTRIALLKKNNFQHLLFLCLIVFSVFGFFVKSATAQTIDTYAVDITVTRDAEVAVVEERTYVGGVLPRQPIVRTIPKLHAQAADTWLTQRVIMLEDVVASQGSTSVPVVVSERDDVWEITLKTDLYTSSSSATSSEPYRLEYRLAGALSYYQNRSPELYFDAISHNQNIPVRRAVVTLHDPNNIFSNERSCYFGPQGGSSSCGLPSVATSSVVFATRNLTPNDGLTISQGLTRGVASVTFTEYVWWKVAVVGGVVLVLLAFVFWPLFRPRKKEDEPEFVDAPADSTSPKDSV